MSDNRAIVLCFEPGADVARSLRAAVDATRERSRPTLVVIGAHTALRGALAGVVARAQARDDRYRDTLDALGREWCAALRGWLPPSIAAELRARVDDDVKDLADACHAIRGGAGGDTPAARALVHGAGAYWTSQALAAMLNAEGIDARWLDARDLLRASDAAAPTLEVEDPTDALTGPCVVLPGGVAQNLEGEPMTLSAGGDARAAVALGAHVGARAIELWAHGGAAYSADPSRVAEAHALSTLSAGEARALAGLSTTSWHPPAWTEAIARAIELTLRDVDDPAHPGTSLTASSSARGVVAVRLREGLCLLRTEGDGLASLTQPLLPTLTALRYASATAEMALHVGAGDAPAVLVPRDRADAAATRAEHSWRWEDRGRHVQRVTRQEASLVAAVGEGVAADPAIVARFFKALAGSPLLAFGGAGGATLAAAVPPERGAEALRALHSAFIRAAL